MSDNELSLYKKMSHSFFIFVFPLDVLEMDLNNLLPIRKVNV